MSTITIACLAFALGTAWGVSATYWKVQEWKRRGDHWLSESNDARVALARALRERQTACFAAYANGVEMGAEIQAKQPSPHPHGHRVSCVESLDEFAPKVIS